MLGPARPEARKLMGGLTGLVRGIAIGSWHAGDRLLCRRVRCGPAPPGPALGRGWSVRLDPLCMGPKFHLREWIQFDGRLESGVQSCSRIAGSMACSEYLLLPSNRCRM